MAKLKLKGKELRAIGFPEAPVISIAMQVMEKHYKHHSIEEAIDTLKQVLADPVSFAAHNLLAPVAQQLIPEQEPDREVVSLKATSLPYNVFGGAYIEADATSQMNLAVRLPISVAGALMPDAHAGYGLPIGGVLATENAVIPYGVGVDIGCCMCLSIFDINPKELTQREHFFARELDEATLFGSGKQFDVFMDHPVFERPEFNEVALLRGLQGKAAKQLGSSGSGNHFVEFGIVELKEWDAQLDMAPGTYLGLLSHSGSRALGANVANHYTQVAKEKRLLPSEAGHLAWLSMDEQEGVEYWMAMNLAGDYASACHHVIHAKIARQLGRAPMKMIENHHNFAWKEWYEGREVIMHRKGATPAGKDVLGIIPGSMTAPGFLVKGKGEVASLYSASHGAGRQMSRSAALNSITKSALQEMLSNHGVKLLGGGLDEAPHAYKDIHTVMKAQQHLVDTVGTFYPKIVKMDGTAPKPWMKKGGG